VIAVLLSMPGQRQVRNLLVILAVAAAATVAGALAAELSEPRFSAAPITRPLAIVAHPSASRAGGSACDCAGNGRSPRPLPPTNGRLASPQSASLSAQSAGRGPAPEAGSFGAWTRAESDPRTILARLAALSRNAPPRYASDPGTGFASTDIR
jgi:hypothetical protein